MPEPDGSDAVEMYDNTDIAVLRVRRSLMTGENAEAAFAKMPVLQLGTSSNLRPPKKLYALGFPAGMEFGDTPTPTEGTFAGGITDGDGQWLKFQGMISVGHSGGPVITEDGKVVGWNVRNNIHVTLERDVYTHLGDDVRVKVPNRGISGMNHVRPIEAARPSVEAAGGRWEDLWA